MEQRPAAVRLLGLRVHLATLADLNEHVAGAIRHGRRSIVAHHNLNSLYHSRRDPRVRAFYREADLVHVDGMAVVAIGRLLGLPLRRVHRTTYVDWVWPLMRRAAADGWRVFYLGGRPGVAQRAAERLRESLPGLEIETAHGYFEFGFDRRDDELVVEKINAFRPHVLMVGMGMPRQERWILHRFDELDANAILQSGACFDYVAGAIPTPPRWLGRFGLEWLYRLACEPGRLWRRYLVEPWLVGAWLIRDVLRRIDRPR